MSVPAPQSQQYWDDLRHLFPIFRTRRYYGTCSQGALCIRVEGAVARYLSSWREDGCPWEGEWLPVVSGAADRFATLIGAPRGAVGVTASVSAAVGAIVSSLDLHQRRRVVVSELEFPTLPHILLAYRQRGLLDLAVVPAPHGEVALADFARFIDEQTALVCVSQVAYATGAWLPVAEVTRLAHAAGAQVLVDAYQASGAIAFDVQQTPVDFLVSGAQKYLLGTSGLGFAYVRPDLTPRLEPMDTGWLAQADPFAVDLTRLQFAEGGARLQGGTFSVPGAYAAAAGLDLLLEIGVPQIEQRVLELTRAFTEGLIAMGVKPLGPTSAEGLGPLVAVPAPDPHALSEALLRHEGMVTAPRNNGVRFAFHFYNNHDDVAAALGALQRHLH